MTLRPRYQWLLLVAVVLGVYYPAIFGGVSAIDDIQLLNGLANLESFDFARLFVFSQGYYYRPLAFVTFYLDQMLWDAQPLFMHLENILLHACNATLVFLLARRLCRAAPKLPNWLPLLTALLFALHPVNSEAVCWISGRYDLLAASFVLAAYCLLFWAMDGPSPWRMLPAILLALIGCLAKETALFAFGGAVCILFALARTRVASLGAAVRLALPGTLLWCVGVLAYLGIRYWGLSGRDTGVGAILKSAGATAGVYGWADQVRVAVKVSGFYAKKIFFPYPLNFAITEISDLYLAVGCLLLIVIVWLVRRGDLPAALFLACILTASSALLVVFGKMAWTLLAERYLYLPSTFFVLGWTALAASGVNAQIVRGLTVTMLAFVVLWGALTIQRAQLWSDPVALLEDTVNKSPNFMQTRKDLANYYLARGETTKARQLLESVVQDAHGTDYVAGDVSMALHLAKEGQLVEAHRLLTLRLQTSGKNYVNVTEALLKINDQRLVEAAAASDRLDIHRENIKLLEALLQRNRDPFLEYRLAKECLASGDAKRARTLFESSYRKAPDSAHYKAAARKLADKLAAEDHG